jgi:L,D-transpeptidase catalytic domain
LTIEKANPVDMVGPGYNIEVPWSVRITWSGDYLHDAYWSVGDQGFTNVSHGCVNMSPANAETFYEMAVPGDPVKIHGSPGPASGTTAGPCGSGPGISTCAAARCTRRCGPARTAACSSAHARRPVATGTGHRPQHPHRTSGECPKPQLVAAAQVVGVHHGPRGQARQ